MGESFVIEEAEMKSELISFKAELSLQRPSPFPSPQCLLTGRLGERKGGAEPNVKIVSVFVLMQTH